MQTLRWSIAVSVGTLIVGCTEPRNASGPVSSLDSGEAAEMNASRAKFEQTKDPPVSAQTRFAAGQLAESQGSVQQAIRQYREAVKADPSHAPSWYRLGMLYTQGQMFPDAIAAWERYAETSGNRAGGYNNLALCFEQAGKLDEADATFRKGLEADTKSEVLNVNYGLFLARRGDTEPALERLKQVLRPADAHYNLASVYEQQGAVAKAKAEYRRALELDPKLHDAKAKLMDLK